MKHIFIILFCLQSIVSFAQLVGFTGSTNVGTFETEDSILATTPTGRQPRLALADDTGILYRWDGSIFVGDVWKTNATNIWDLSKKIGLGTSTPYSLFSNTSSNVSDNWAGTNQSNGITWNTGTSSSNYAVAIRNESSQGNGLLIEGDSSFYEFSRLLTVGAADNSNTLHFVIKGNGNAGFKVSNPEELIHANGNVLLNYGNYYKAKSFGDKVHNLLGSNSASDTEVLSLNGEDLKFMDSIDVNMIIKGATGNIGIGTTSPSAPLSFAQTVTTYPKLSLYSGFGYGFGVTGGDLDYYSASHHRWHTGATSSTQGTEIMSLVNTGDLGIGVSSPARKLDVNGQIRMRTGATAGYIILGDGNGDFTWTDPAVIDGVWSINGLNDIYHPTTRVGIQTDSPTKALTNSDENPNDGYAGVYATGFLWNTDSLSLNYTAAIRNEHTGGSGLLVQGSSSSQANTRLLHVTNSNASSTSRFLVEGDGKIGVNTNNPSVNFDVNGQIRMRTGATNGYIPVSDVNGVMTWTNPTTLSTDGNIPTASLSADGDYTQDFNDYQFKAFDIDDFQFLTNTGTRTGVLELNDQLIYTLKDGSSDERAGIQASTYRILNTGIWNVGFKTGITSNYDATTWSTYFNDGTTPTGTGSILQYHDETTDKSKYSEWTIDTDTPTDGDGQYLLDLSGDDFTIVKPYGEIAPSSPSTTQHNWNPTNFTSTNETMIVLSLSAATSLTGLQAKAVGGKAIISNHSSFNLTLEFQDTGSSAANRFQKMPGNADLILTPGDAATLVYSTAVSSGWIVTAVAQ